MSLILSLVVQSAVFFALAEWLLRRRGLSLARLGLGRLTWRQGAQGIGFGVILFAASNVLGSALDAALRHTLASAVYLRVAGPQWAQQDFARFDAPWQRLAFVLTGTIAAPLGEEAFFRGYLYTALRARKGVMVAVGCSALIFALCHLSPITAACMIFLMGMALATAYERTGSLWVPILMHSVNNTLSFLLLWKQTS